MTYQPVFEPYDHQKKALGAMAGREGFALFMAMRTGKTKTLIDEWGSELVGGNAHDMLVIAPAGVYSVWETEIEKHLPKVLRDRTYVEKWVSSSRQNLDSFFAYQGSRIFLVNIEALSYGDRCLSACLRFLGDEKRSTIVVDESTIIKNPEANRTKAVCMMAPLARRRRIASGLPTPRSVLDLFSQMWFLDPKILNFKNYYAFRDRYAIMRKIKVGRRSVRIVVGYRNLEEIQPKIKDHSFRVRLEDCYDVPPKAYSFREVPLTDEQKRMYDDMKKRATTKLASGEHVTATEVIVQMLRLHQLCCGHLVDEDGTEHAVPTNRITELQNLLREYDGKAVVWCSYDHDVRVIAAALRKEYGEKAVACFWGGNRETREEDNKRFQEDPDCLWMVATPGAGGRGRMWAMAGMLVYYSNTDNLEHRDQSEERASAVDRTDRVTVVDMIAKDTVEMKIVLALRAKMDMAGVITGDNYREWLV